MSDYKLSAKQISEYQGDVAVLMARGATEAEAWAFITAKEEYADHVLKAMRQPATSKEPVAVQTLAKSHQDKVATERKYMEEMKIENMRRSHLDLKKALQTETIYI